jgi:hypothetical protein
MPTFIVERYIPDLPTDGLRGLIERERIAMASIAAERDGVRHVRSTYMRDDEVCLSLYLGPSAAAVRDANTRADLPFERISEAIDYVVVDS